MIDRDSDTDTGRIQVVVCIDSSGPFYRTNYGKGASETNLNLRAT